MISFDEAIALLDAAVIPLPSERIALAEAAGRYLAEDLVARLDAPRADVSQMDGYAVRLADAEAGEWLAVSGEARPGMPVGRALERGEAVRIFTGASVPAGADCVVMQEYAERDGERVRFSPGFGPARHIRSRASDFAAGDVLLARGQHLTAPAIVAAAAADHAEVEVFRAPRMAIVATGNELAPPGDAHTSESAVPESASFGVSALCTRMGAGVASLERGRDDLAELSALAASALERADGVIVIGGASVGDHDLARPMFEHLGLDLIFSRLAIKPGKPVWFGKARGKPVLGLPGNPTSALVTARLFLQPLLARMQGGDALGELATLPVPLASPVEATSGRETFVRATATPGGLQPSGNQQSGAQSPLASANYLVRRPAHSPALEAGALVEALAL